MLADTTASSSIGFRQIDISLPLKCQLPVLLSFAWSEYEASKLEVKFEKETDIQQQHLRGKECKADIPLRQKELGILQEESTPPAAWQWSMIIGELKRCQLSASRIDFTFEAVEGYGREEWGWTPPLLGPASTFSPSASSTSETWSHRQFYSNTTPIERCRTRLAFQILMQGSHWTARGRTDRKSWGEILPITVGCLHVKLWSTVLHNCADYHTFSSVYF